MKNQRKGGYIVARQGER